MTGTNDVTFVGGPQFVTSNARDTVYAGFDTLSREARASFLGEALEYFGVKPEND